MSHKFKVVEEPHTNKDGSKSKTKKDYVLTDRHRSGSTVIAHVTSKKALEDEMIIARGQIIMRHMAAHPNDKAFRAKHGIKS